MNSGKGPCTLAGMPLETCTVRRQLPLKWTVGRTAPSRAAAARCGDARATPSAMSLLSPGSNCCSSTDRLTPSPGRRSICCIASTSTTEAMEHGHIPTRKVRGGLAAATSSPKAEPVAKARVLRRTASCSMQLTAASSSLLSSHPPPPPAAVFPRTFAHYARGGAASLCVERRPRGNGEQSGIVETPSMRRRASVDEGTPHTVSSCGGESRRMLRPTIVSRPTLREVAPAATTRARLQRLATAPTIPQDSLTAKGEEKGVAFSPFRFCVGAAVGNSGQRPFIRYTVRGGSSCLVMPSLNSRRTPTTVHTAHGPCSDSTDMSASNGSILMCMKSTAAPPGQSRRASKQIIKAAREPPAQILHHPHGSDTRKQQQQQQREEELWRATSAVARDNGVFVTPLDRNTSTARRTDPARVPFARQVSQLCLLVLQERDRRLLHQKALREREAVEIKPIGKEEAVWRLARPPSMDSLRTAAVSSPPTLYAEEVEAAEAGEQMAPPEVVLECVRTVLEKRGMPRRQDPDASMKLMTTVHEPPYPCGVSSSVSSSGADVISRWSDVATDAAAAGDNGGKVVEVNTGETEAEGAIVATFTEAETKEAAAALDEEVDEEDDSSWGADEDPWWCFDMLWCASLEHLPPPPDFVPPISFASIRIPDDVEALVTMYAIPMPSPVNAFRCGGAEACGKPPASSRRLPMSFSDTSDALAGGRGAQREANQLLRKLRIQQLLLETHERRSRRMLNQEETTAWKAMIKERGLAHARHGRR
ncbi:hypothetical protein TraAM80_01307 [Trypanosoma rangeli]|uniref:Uncharacterized protein n=1 Tax=Trypanosoma rangeli TaxID=5698 RepID=A0A422NZ58_TRYRA|nr:uncharacterized protein TraAM80_01307 [Trypanosoma rangeli]RNF10746.1 hypothetical protein TraAM80_01307 [Trypanosoma rangeli]|eukprot:RNF10746.1 hypothetical protein TraAM80_01307 [Trypanosoma rangeli]